MNTGLTVRILSLLLLLITAALYLPFVENPLVFDDQPLFMVDAFGKMPVSSFEFTISELRSLPYVSLSWTQRYLGPEIMYLRTGNWLLHAATAIVLFGVLRLLLEKTATKSEPGSLTPVQASFAAALLFALNPVSVYATGYLVQRTILMATLFGLLAIWSYVKGNADRRPVWLWISVVCYYLAVYSKEHAVMLAFVLPLTSYWLHPDWRQRVKQQVLPVLALFLIAVSAVLARKSLMAATYEPTTLDALGFNPGPMAYPLSVVTQCGLFFKYLGLWLAPSINWMAIDMPQQQAESLLSLNLIGPMVYLVWGGVGLLLLKRRGMLGILGMAMVFPWLLFWTELYSTRIAEPFVLYRSYLWMSLPFMALAWLMTRFNKGLAALVVVAIAITFFVSSMERLATMANPILLWADAKKLLQDRPAPPGAYRIYYNLGKSQLLGDMLEPSEDNLKKAISLRPGYAPPYAALGAIYNRQFRWEEAQNMYSQALKVAAQRKDQNISTYLMGRARALEGGGRGQEAIRDYVEACRIDIAMCEVLRKSASPQHKSNL
jgi:protein O-mannosyl-transferase